MDDDPNRQRDPLDHRVVALKDGGDDKLSKSWDGEDRLDDGRAADQEGEVDTEDRHCRESRVAKHVAGEHTPLRDPFRPCRAHEVLSHCLQDRIA